MITLHSIRQQLPYAHVPPMTQHDWDMFELDEDDNMNGLMLDMWIEDEGVVGLWRTADSEEPFVVSLSADYRPESSYLYSDLRYVRDRAREGTGSEHFIYEYNILSHRGQTSRQIIEPSLEDTLGI